MTASRAKSLLAKADAYLLGDPLTPPSSFVLKAAAAGVAVLLLAFVLTGGCAKVPEPGTAGDGQPLRSVIIATHSTPQQESEVVWYPDLRLVCLLRNRPGTGMACWDPEAMYTPVGIVNVLRRHQAKAKADPDGRPDATIRDDQITKD